LPRSGSGDRAPSWADWLDEKAASELNGACHFCYAKNAGGICLRNAYNPAPQIEAQRGA
jgi:hypothetical protein